jgi:hypothetical protein
MALEMSKHMSLVRSLRLRWKLYLGWWLEWRLWL